ncbi:MAG TPA: hypothetical protein VLN45_06630 [Ignavibacteriaceae bacterium]|nr:hypothetical protein [Ignavibacteriaceae bacterium]
MPDNKGNILNIATIIDGILFAKVDLFWFNYTVELLSISISHYVLF